MLMDDKCKNCKFGQLIENLVSENRTSNLMCDWFNEVTNCNGVFIFPCGGAYDLTGKKQKDEDFINSHTLKGWDSGIIEFYPFTSNCAINRIQNEKGLTHCPNPNHIKKLIKKSISEIEKTVMVMQIIKEEGL